MGALVPFLVVAGLVWVPVDHGQTTKRKEQLFVSALQTVLVVLVALELGDPERPNRPGQNKETDVEYKKSTKAN